MKSLLMLQDGKLFKGRAIGASKEVCGELIVNTAVVGWQEMLTDPANCGKILVFTYPLIGNYGFAGKFNESRKVWVAGLVIKEESRIFSNWQARTSFFDFLKKNDLVGIADIDTRTLAVHLRQKGPLRGVISSHSGDGKELLARVQDSGKQAAESRLPEISVPKKTILGKAKKGAKTVAVLDLGVTASLVRQLQVLGWRVVVFPFSVSAQEIMRLRPSGVIISGGPEDDPGIEKVVPTVTNLVGKVPLLGISTGHQVLARALGGRISRMKIAHRGVNYPILGGSSYKGEITVQNHAFAIEAASLSKIKGVKITASNLNDRSVEEFEAKKLRLIGVQYYVSSPDFGEAHPVFNRFSRMFV